jgi:hypothetical protein
VKTAEHRKFYGLVPEMTEEYARGHCTQMLRQPWEVDPYDPKELVFERHQQGRVAYVTRKNGDYALQARHKTNPNMAWKANPYLTRTEGRWRVFW